MGESGLDCCFCDELKPKYESIAIFGSLMEFLAVRMGCGTMMEINYSSDSLLRSFEEGWPLRMIMVERSLM